MDLRGRVGHCVIEKLKYKDFGRSRFRYMSAQDDRFQKNANAQGIVLKVEHRTADHSAPLGSTMLTGDSDAETWRGIMQDYELAALDTTILMGGHHGSITFFDDPSDKKNYYGAHVRGMSPGLTVISVGPNSHGHPDAQAVSLYEKYTIGSNVHPKKVYRTDKDGTKVFEMNDDGSTTFG